MFVPSGALTTAELEERIVYLAVRMRRRMAEWLALVAEFDHRGCARGTRFRGTAEWLAWECRLTARTAREHVRVARRLAEMPSVRAAFGDGRLSYSQVRALARADSEEDDAALLQVALTSTTGELERHVRALRSAASADLDVANAGHARRTLEWFWDDDGSLKFFGRLGAVEGAAFVEAIETAEQAVHAPRPAAVEPEGGPVSGGAEPDHCGVTPRPGRGARRADALAEIALSGCPRTHLVLHADPAALACEARGEEPRAGEICAVRDGPAIPSETARRLTCDADVSLADVDLGRTQRVISPALRRALEARDSRVCAMPGCDRTHGLAGHHVVHWSHGGRTDLDNLVLLCRYHHRLFHEEGFGMLRRDGRLVIRDPDGIALHALPGRAPPVDVAA